MKNWQMMGTLTALIIGIVLMSGCISGPYIYNSPTMQSIHITGTGSGDYPFTVPYRSYPSTGSYAFEANFAGGDPSFVVRIKNEQGVYVQTVLFDCVNTSGCAPIKNKVALVNLKDGKYFLEVLNDPPYQKKYNVAPWSIDITSIIY